MPLTGQFLRKTAETVTNVPATRSDPGEKRTHRRCNPGGGPRPSAAVWQAALEVRVVSQTFFQHFSEYMSEEVPSFSPDIAPPHPLPQGAFLSSWSAAARQNVVCEERRVPTTTVQREVF